jgi:hypothetical protein
MRKSKWHMAIGALVLTGVMALTVPVWAQQGRGGGPQGPGNQSCMGGQGSGQGGAYCPANQQGNANCPYYNSDNPQAPQAPRGRRGMRGGPGNQPAPQTPAPAPGTSQQ